MTLLKSRKVENPFVAEKSVLFASDYEEKAFVAEKDMRRKINLFKKKTVLGKVSKEKLVEFSTKRGGVRIGRFSTKNKNCSKHWK